MRLTVFLLTAAFIHVHATTVGQKVTISGKDLQLKQVFAAVENQTGYVIFYNENFFAGTKPVTLSVHEMPLNEFLNVVLKEQPLDYVIQGNTIFLSRKVPGKTPDPSPRQPVNLIQAAAPPVTGIIRDANGEPLQRATILIKG